MRYGRERKLPEGVLVEFFRCPAGAGRAEREPGNGQLACRLMENGRRLGRRRPANIRLSPGVPRRLRPNPRQTYFVILSEAKNLFPCEPKAACGLCLARRRKTNEVQSNICIVSIQILRRSAPQNDKLLNCSQTPQQTGICNWRQRGEVKGKDRCSGRSQLAELNTGFSRASRSPAPRRLADTCPAGFGTRTFAPPLSKPGDCELQKRRTRKTGAKQPQTNNDFP